jgi:hypothetical protein
MRDAVLDGQVQGGAVSAGLAGGDNLQAGKQSGVHGLRCNPKTSRFAEGTDAPAQGVGYQPPGPCV